MSVYGLVDVGGWTGRGGQNDPDGSVNRLRTINDLNELMLRDERRRKVE